MQCVDPEAGFSWISSWRSVRAVRLTAESGIDVLRFHVEVVRHQ